LHDKFAVVVNLDAHAALAQLPEQAYGFLFHFPWVRSNHDGPRRVGCSVAAERPDGPSR
tara:strand:+ start:548 stop:724 length:177 start_codon:yes stop_codon:yes gene_type:complete